ncbi:BspA family leucine-rich repeat surface protein [Enterococcus mundtii]|uniref:BspA family leucine-rich repeat surface protein n=1 Tax=Enterococcus mundtii TaxID=53346 RepID=UPI000BB56FEF|nr:BspA family leucine-rich repeat surface protein [Enterococcus mundtii]
MKIKKALIVVSTSLLFFPSLFSLVIKTSMPVSAIQNSVELPKEPELHDPLNSTTETKAPIFSFEENQEPLIANKQFQLVVRSSQEVSEFVLKLPKGVSIVEDQQSTDSKFTNIEGNQWQVQTDSPQVTFSIPLMVEEAGEYEVTIGESKTILNIHIEESRETTESETISSQEKELEKDEKLNGENEANTNQKIEDERINTARNGTWGTVSWSWVASTRTINLRGGDAGHVILAPWRTHRDVQRIVVEARVTLPEDSSRLFNSLQNLERIDNVERINTSNVTSMLGMFSGASNLKTLNVSNWDTSNVTDMQGMFNGARSLETLNVSNWDTSRVTSMSVMFQNVVSLQEIDVSSWNTSRVTSMGWMFNRASNLKTLNVSNWDTSNVTDMQGMFHGASSLETLNVSNWDTSNVTSMNAMFQNVVSLQEIDVSNWDTSNVTSMNAMFQNVVSLQEIDVSSWNTSRVTNMGWMFHGASSLETLNVSNWDTSRITSMHAMFNGASNLKTLNVSNWNTSRVAEMSLMFQNVVSLQEINVSNWNTSRVTSMGWMFNGASNLKTLNVSNWDTTNVSVATSMFSNTTNLSELRLGTNSRFDHLVSPPTMPTITSSDNYTGNWVYYLNQANIIPEAYIASSSANFWQEYDGSNPGTYQWQKKGSVTVHYRSINDQEVIAPEIITGGIREPFQIEEKAIEGYTLQEIPDNISGRFTEEEQAVIFRYMKNTVDPEDQGLLSIDFVSSFNFGAQAISVHDQTYYAQPQRLLNGDGTVNEIEERPNYVQISDRRPESERNGWELAVTQQEQFKGKGNQVLNGASITLLNQQVVTAQGGTAPELQSVHPLIPGNRQRLLKAQGSEGMGTWIYRFGDAETAKESVALNIPKGANPEATTYSTKLTWELSRVPDN